MPRLHARALVVALLGVAAACAGDEPRQSRGQRGDDGMTSPTAPPVTGSSGAPEPTSALDDAGAPPACDDHGAIVDPLVLELAPASDNPCRQRLARPPTAFEPARLAVELDGSRLQHDPDGYRLEGDVIVLLGRACERLGAADAGEHRLRAEYGACQLPGQGE